MKFSLKQLTQQGSSEGLCVVAVAAVVGAGDAATRAADVIDGDFDDVRRHP